LPPLVYIVLAAWPLDEALQEVIAGTGCGAVLDPRVGDRATEPVTAALPNVLLDTAVRGLADMAGLKPVRMDNLFYVTTPENAGRLRAEQERHLRPPSRKYAGNPSSSLK
jgi:hypothetical protein